MMMGDHDDHGDEIISSDSAPAYEADLQTYNRKFRALDSERVGGVGGKKKKREERKKKERHQQRRATKLHLQPGSRPG